MRNRLFYDLLAPVYGRIIPALFADVMTRTMERTIAGAPEAVLEVGIGPGYLLAEAGKSEGFRLAGTDSSLSMVKRARRRLKGKPASLAVANVRALPFRSGSFEGVVSVFVLDAMPREDLEAILGEISRVIAPGGRVVIGSIRFSKPIIKRAWMALRSVVPPLVGNVRPTDVREYIENAGLRVAKEETVDQIVGAEILTLMKVMG